MGTEGIEPPPDGYSLKTGANYSATRLRPHNNIN